ncbi:hypothetical protein GGS20DRAFT_528129 [Poronia punctata]|nr:hypothetical protein GGS20DRAFT_528129 [Poronia punctata]
MTKLTLNNPTIPPNSLILVTGANGLIGSWVVSKLLEAGYRVRGTVRSITKSSWMIPFFNQDQDQDQDRFELVQVSDFGAPNAWDGAVKGVAGIAAVASHRGVDVSDLDTDLELEFSSVRNLLVAARNEKTVKSFVLTTSAWAAYTPDPAKKRSLNEWSYNEEAVVQVREQGVGGGSGPFTGYMALKTLLEQKVWEWVRAERLPYSFNTILPETVLGATLSPENQGITSTCSFVKFLRDGVNLDVVAAVRPQRFVDTQDLGLLYVAALTTPDVDGERIFAFGERFSFRKVGEILQGLESGEKREKITILEDDRWDQTEVPNERAEELLRRVSGHGWAKLEDSIADCLASILRSKD